MPFRASRLAVGLFATFALLVSMGSHERVLAQAAPGAEQQAFEAAKELGTVEAWDAFLSNYPKGFHADLARAYVKKLAEPSAAQPLPGPAASPQPAPSVPAAEMVKLNAHAIRVGKWPERAAFDGRSLWVSESGNRSVVEIDLATRNVGRRLGVGRLPVDMVATERGDIYALAETDNTIHALARGTGTAGEFASVPRCADLLAYSTDNLWVVSNLNCSAPAILTRVSSLNGRASKVADLQGGPADMRAAHGFIYVSHMSTGGRGAFVSIVDAGGSASATPDLPMHYPRLAANAIAVFAGGAPADQASGVIVKIAAGQAAFSGERRVPEPISAMAATDSYVIAAGRRGTIYVLSAGDLSLLRTITTSVGMEPHDVLAIGNTLAVVSSKGSEVVSDNAVFLLDGWMPGTAPGVASGFIPSAVPAVPAYEQEAPRAQPARERPVKQVKCDSGYVKVKGKCVRERKKQVQRDNCPGDSVLKNGRCVKEEEPEFKPPIKCTGGQLYSMSQQTCVCQDGLLWNGQRCYLP